MKNNLFEGFYHSNFKRLSSDNDDEKTWCDKNSEVICVLFKLITTVSRVDSRSHDRSHYHI